MATHLYLYAGRGVFRRQFPLSRYDRAVQRAVRSWLSWLPPRRPTSIVSRRRCAALEEIAARLEAAAAAPGLHQQLLVLKATGHLEAGERAPALSTARGVLDWAVTHGEPLLAGRTRNMLGLVHWRLGDLPQALELFAQAREAGGAVGDAFYLAEARRIRGT